MRPPSFSTRTSSAISPSPPCSRASRRRPSKIALHRGDAHRQAHQVQSAGDAREVSGPGHEFRPVSRRQPKQLADHRERQCSRVAFDEVRRVSIREQLAGEFIGDGEDARLHGENGAAAEGFVDDAPQPCVIGLVHRQHVFGERAQEAWNPPAKPGRAAAILAHGEGFVVLQHAAGELVRGRDPGLADDGKFDLDQRSQFPQPLDAGPRVAQKVLAAQIHPYRHGCPKHGVPGSARNMG